MPKRDWLQVIVEADLVNKSPRFDLIAELYNRNLDHVVEDILNYLDPLSR